jgi:hypothetical protein
MELFTGDCDVCERLISLLEYMSLCGVGGLPSLPDNVDDDSVQSALEKGTYYRAMLTPALLSLSLPAQLQYIEDKFSEIRERVNVMDAHILVTRSDCIDLNAAISRIWHRVKRLSSRLDICLHAVMRVVGIDSPATPDQQQGQGQGQGQYLVLTCRPAGTCTETIGTSAPATATSACRALLLQDKQCTLFGGTDVDAYVARAVHASSTQADAAGNDAGAGIFAWSTPHGSSCSSSSSSSSSSAASSTSEGTHPSGPVSVSVSLVCDLGGFLVAGLEDEER